MLLRAAMRLAGAAVLGGAAAAARAPAAAACARGALAAAPRPATLATASTFPGRARRGAPAAAAAPAAAPAGAAAAPPAPLDDDFEAVVGIECHVQLSARTKAFCGCENRYGAPPNSLVCPVCLGHPGALPALNAAAVEKGALIGLALGCTVALRSKFDRKQYFYPDLPKGYQISQFDEPLCAGGAIDVPLPEADGGGSVRVGITRAHLEEDAGKLVYAGADALHGSDYSLIDFNRAGVALLEIVSEPDMRSGKEAAAFGAELRRIVRFLGASDGNMQSGSMRCDVNVSVRPRGQAALGTKVEVKNMNSFSAMQRAIEFEVARQAGAIRAGRGAAEVVQETRLWDEGRQETRTMRVKEGLADYRFFPEPDLPPLELTAARVEELRAGMPELPAAKRARFTAAGLSEYDAAVLADDLETADYFDAVLAAGAPAKPAANWVMGDVTAHCKEAREPMSVLRLTPAQLAEAIALIESGAISGKIAKELLPELLAGAAGAAGGVAALVEARGLGQISDPTALLAMVDGVLAANPGQLADFRGGKTKLKGFFVGQLMKASGGRANPGELNRLLDERLAEG
jgi:aspartyl-tRNA(Asn)/glutamyl-tRNA(Gln) amidotransferase subunit B